MPTLSWRLYLNVPRFNHRHALPSSRSLGSHQRNPPHATYSLGQEQRALNICVAQKTPELCWRWLRSRNPLTLRDDLHTTSSKRLLALLTSSCGLLLGRACNYEDDECTAREHSHTNFSPLSFPPTSFRVPSVFPPKVLLYLPPSSLQNICSLSSRT